jgi:hypothetical protein
VEAQWLAAACANTGDVTADCGGVRAQCVAGRCVERPPEPLPRDWKRLSLPATLSVFAPADFLELGVHEEDSLVRVFQGERRSIELSLDPYASPTVDEALRPHLEVLDGERAQVYFADRGADAGAHRYEAAAVFERHWSEFFLSGGYLSMRLWCADARACADRDAIFRSARVLIQPIDVEHDR